RARRDPANILLEPRIPNIQQMINLADNASRIHVDRRYQELFHQHVNLRTRISSWFPDLLHRLQGQIFRGVSEHVQSPQPLIDLPEKLAHLKLLTKPEEQRDEKNSEEQLANRAQIPEQST